MKKGKLYLLVTLALTLIISVVCASVSAFAAESSVNNGWGTAPEGKNIEAINDLKEVEGYGEGYTSISGLHANSAANATPLDLTKPKTVRKITGLFSASRLRWKKRKRWTTKFIRLPWRIIPSCTCSTRPPGSEFGIRRRVR